MQVGRHTWVVLGLGRPEGMPRASNSAELMEAAAMAFALLRGGLSACAMALSSRTICTALRNAFCQRRASSRPLGPTAHIIDVRYGPL